MIHAPRKLRSPLKWHGGKSYLARRIVSLMPACKLYFEPFVGGGSVLLNKLWSVRELATDWDPDLVRFWRFLRDYPRTLDLILAEVPYTRESWASWSDPHDSPIDPARRAAAFLIRNRFSRGGLGKSFAWSDRVRGGMPGDANAWRTIRDEIYLISERIKQVEFLESDALKAIRYFDDRDTLFYLDPPYLPSTRTVPKAYRHEMTRQQHEALLVLVQECRGVVMLSGYRSALYDEALVGWTRHDFDMPNHSGQGKAKQRRTECLWINRGGPRR